MRASDEAFAAGERMRSALLARGLRYCRGSLRDVLQAQRKTASLVTWHTILGEREPYVPAWVYDLDCGTGFRGTPQWIGGLVALMVDDEAVRVTALMLRHNPELLEEFYVARCTMHHV